MEGHAIVCPSDVSLAFGKESYPFKTFDMSNNNFCQKLFNNTPGRRLQDYRLLTRYSIVESVARCVGANIKLDACRHLYGGMPAFYICKRKGIMEMRHYCCGTV